jgi:hypothetical protein
MAGSRRTIVNIPTARAGGAGLRKRKDVEIEKECKAEIYKEMFKMRLGVDFL